MARKLGKPLPPVKDVAAPSQEQIDKMIADWDTYAPPKYRGLLAARPLGTDDPKARWFYDSARRRYVSKSGKVLSPRELRQAYLDFQKAKNK